MVFAQKEPGRGGSGETCHGFPRALKSRGCFGVLDSFELWPDEATLGWHPWYLPNWVVRRSYGIPNSRSPSWLKKLFHCEAGSERELFSDGVRILP